MSTNHINLENILKDLISDTENDIKSTGNDNQELYLEPTLPSSIREDDPFHKLGMNTRNQVTPPYRGVRNPSALGKSIKTPENIGTQDTFFNMFLKKGNTLKRGRGGYNR